MSRLRRKVLRVGSAGLAVGALIHGTLVANQAAAQSSEAKGDPPDLSVSVSKARQLCFSNNIDVTGVLAARELVDVVPEGEGLKVTQVLVGPLEEVAPGQVLARLGRADEGAGASQNAPMRAPVGGIVVRSNAVIGMPVSPRQGPLFAIIAGGEIELLADVPQNDLRKLAIGQKVIVRPLGLPEIEGKVRTVETIASPATQLGRVRIGLASGSDARIGTFARGTVLVGERCGIAVPYSAVSYEAEGTIVHVVNGERIEARPVELGLLSGRDTEITSGLSENDLVVVRAGAFVREGDRVNPIALAEPGEKKDAPRR